MATQTVLTALFLLIGGSSSASEPPPTLADGAKPAVVYQDDRYFEGPSWDPKSGKLYFTAFGKSTQILRLDAPGKVTVWLDKTEGVNGTYLGRDGRLLAAQTYGHRVLSYAIGPDGPTDTRILYHDPSLNQPNDVCQAANADIYFTDPDFAKLKTSGVYLLKPNGKVTKVISDMPLPNGLKTSLDGKTFYVSDSSTKLWRSYPIRDDGTLGIGTVFFNPEAADRSDPDGMSIDADGNLYCTGRGGVWVVRPDGHRLGFIPFPDFCSNVTFGGPDGTTLFVTGNKKVWALKMKVRGGQFKR
jgi:gluconolactonase